MSNEEAVVVEPVVEPAKVEVIGSGVTPDGLSIQGTTQEIATLLDIDYPTARGVLAFFLKREIAVELGKRSSGKGKPSTIYRIPRKIEINLD